MGFHLQAEDVWFGFGFFLVCPILLIQAKACFLLLFFLALTRIEIEIAIIRQAQKLVWVWWPVLLEMHNCCKVCM